VESRRAAAPFSAGFRRRGGVKRSGPWTLAPGLDIFEGAAMADPVADAYLKQLELIENDLVGLACAMPADRYDFRPAGAGFDGVRTFGEEVRHAATMIFMTAAIVLQEKSPYGAGANDNGPPDIQGKDRIVDYLHASIRYARAALSSLTTQNHLDPLKTYFGSQPRLEVASGIIYHSYNHYGQMVVYARMNGVKPPSPAAANGA
jgi:hypothetical protein